MNKIKLQIVCIVSTLTSLLGTLAIPVYILLACNLFDYCTGIFASIVRNEKVSSYRGIIGIAKKVFMYILIVLGVFMDIILRYALTTLNIPIVLPFIFGCMISIWLVINEMISIVENLHDIGVRIPPFVLSAFNKLKTKIEKKGEDISDIISDENRPNEDTKNE